MNEKTHSEQFDLDLLKNSIVVDLRQLAERQGFQQTKEWAEAELSTLMHMPVGKPF